MRAGVQVRMCLDVWACKLQQAITHVNVLAQHVLRFDRCPSTTCGAAYTRGE